MIIRVVSYHALHDKDVEKWMQTSASELRGVKGVRRVEFFRNKDDPSQYGSIMHFSTKEDLDDYKKKQEGTYQKLVRSIRETWLDDSQPVTEQIFELLDI
jgi:heme-degrading monooxygenase HmoA